MMMTIAIVEDNPLAASILREYVEADGITVTNLYASGEELLSMIGTLPLPDIVLMDIGLPGMSGIEATRKLKEQYPGLMIVIQSVFEDKESILDAIKAGASGYLLKASSRAEIRTALEEIRSGGCPLSGKIARVILEEYRRNDGPSSDPRARFGLTEREAEILRLLIEGESCKCIAFDLGISVHTVYNHLRSIYEKMSVNSRSEAVARAIGT